MIRTIKNIEMMVHYKSSTDKKEKLKELNLKSTVSIEGNKCPLIIEFEGNKIIVDAYWLKEACEKILEFNKI